ncbi:DHH family phosphoesterase [Corynebacterium lowii]|uniref:Bifunctional oligoribonuclease and PAP phosphatase NrnA n=1 Tax=Corynebacterium lowii TaxID=1544413 RepID=A0A0Q1AIQ5_9CORY|nr:DHH family phosphoesterase [Corynebacterium lowii]KQB86593.1 Bifunctional oligoribonuclease and PAP phosphatase NrnA [Corynebacterium lowii]MDP9851277.1 phosphoesterase RecJ-like protein [Corynebacterium lowii]
MGDLEQVAAWLKTAKKVVVVGHLRPDADAIGSVTALVAALHQRGIEAEGMIGQEQRFAENLYTIPGAQEVQRGDRLPPADLYVAVDCGSLDRTGLLSGEIERNVDKLIVLDHHASNEGFGALNHIAVEAEATTVILYDLFHLMGVEIDRPLAHCLYAGLVTDTGSFRWGGTRMHTIAADLMSRGVDARQVAADLLDQVSAHDLKMVGRVLAGIDVLNIDGLSLALLVAKHRDVVGHSASAVESLVDFVHSIQGCDLGVVFKATSANSWAVSLRSETLDVSQIAVALGGGGHRPSAGYTAVGSYQEAIDELIEVLRGFGDRA